MKNKNILITGGAGFIGSALTKELIKNNTVIVIDNFDNYYDPAIKEENVKPFINEDNYRLYIVDIRDKNALEKVFSKNRIDIIIHLAAMAGVRYSLVNPNLYKEVNEIGTDNVLSIAHKYHVDNIILASSSSVYGNNNLPFNEESTELKPISPYAVTKMNMDAIAKKYHDTYNMNISILRFFNVYGPHQRPDTAISIFTDSILNDKEINLYGDGTTLRDYTYIDDAIEGIVRSGDYLFNHKNTYEVFNIGSNNPISINELLSTISDELKLNPNIRNLPFQEGDAYKTNADINKAYKILGYKPSMYINTGIKKYIKWKKEE